MTDVFSRMCCAGAAQFTRNISTLAPSYFPAATSRSEIASEDSAPATSPDGADSPPALSQSVASKPLAAWKSVPSKLKSWS
jgi:hypothetical protein